MNKDIFKNALTNFCKEVGLSVDNSTTAPKEGKEEKEVIKLGSDKQLNVDLAEDPNAIITALVNFFGVDTSKYGYYSIDLTVWGDGTASFGSWESKDVALKAEKTPEPEEIIALRTENKNLKLAAENTPAVTTVVQAPVEVDNKESMSTTMRKLL